jgi:rare lipoprotein A
MGRRDRQGRILAGARLLALGLGALALANCSGGLSGKSKLGVSASARVVEPGEPVPKGGGVYRVGKPYTIAGRTYVPEEDTSYKAEGLASWYGDDFHGRYTANGEIFDMNAISAAHATMPLPSYARVTNLKNHKSIVVRVNDRGPYAHNRLIDLSVKTAKLLGFYGQGLTKVKVEYVGRAPLAGSDETKLMATLRDNDALPGSKPVMVASNKPYAPTFFDSRPITQVSRPPAKPYVTASAQETAAAEPDDEPATPVEAAPAGRGQPAQGLARAPGFDPERSTSPVSAYASTRYDGHTGFMSGRGLY